MPLDYPSWVSCTQWWVSCTQWWVSCSQWWVSCTQWWVSCAHLQSSGFPHSSDPTNQVDLDWLLLRLSILLLGILYLVMGFLYSVMGFLSSVMGFLCSPPIILFFPQLRSNQVDLDWLLVRLSILLLCRELANFFIFCATNLCFRCINPDKQLFLGLSRPVHAVWVGLTFHAETPVWFLY